MKQFQNSELPKSAFGAAEKSHKVAPARLRLRRRSQEGAPGEEKILPPRDPCTKLPPSQHSGRGYFSFFLNFFFPPNAEGDAEGTKPAIDWLLFAHELVLLRFGRRYR